MPRTDWLACGLIIVTAMAGARAESPGPAALRVPAGFAVERAAGPHEVAFPMFAAFDDRGRLYVAESSGGDLYAELSAGTRRCRVRLLEDRDRDGRFEHSQVFAESLVFPMGLAWREGRLYVADPPNLIALEDLDGDDRADRRSVILTGFGHKDNGSLHGLRFGPDGRLYMTMGTPDGYRLDRGDGTWLEGTSGVLIRCRPDGSRPEVVARGFVNLVEVAFTARGEILGTDNWFQVPSGGLRDALVHLVEGGLYPYAADAGTPQPVTGEPLPPVARYPAVALSGLELYRGQAFPEPLRGNLFSAQHNARKIGRHILIPDGSTFRTEDVDFVTTDDPDFHPSDVVEDGDGSLLVIDTGSWYVQHCPTGRIRTSPAPGGIYRVRWPGASPVPDPWGQMIDWERTPIDRLVALFCDPRLAVRDRAGRGIAARGEESVPHLSSVLKGTSAIEAKVLAVWALATIAARSEPAATAALVPLRDALRGDKADVVAAAARALALAGDHGAEPGLRSLLGAESAPVRLAAAEALAHCGEAQTVPALWQALAGRPDRFLEHALVHAAHRLAGVEALETALRDPGSRVQAAALILLDQPPRPRGASRPGPAIERTTASDPALRQVALGVLRRHPEWADHALGVIQGRLTQAARSEPEWAGLRGVVSTFASDPRIQAIVAEALAGRTGTARLPLIELLAGSPLTGLPASWERALGAAIDDPLLEVRLAAVRAAALLQAPGLDTRLRRLAGTAHEPGALRLEALRAVLPRHPGLTPELSDWVLGCLDDPGDPTLRLTAAAILGRAQLSDAQLRRLIQSTRGDALFAPETLLSDRNREMTAETAEVVVDSVSQALDRGWRPSAAFLQSIEDALPPAVRGARSAELRARARRDLGSQRGRLAELEPLLQGGDSARGRAIFFGPRVGCSACHQVGGSGGSVGPDLSRIGTVRAGRDLLESLVFPAATFSQGFENYSISTADGRTIGGIIVRQTEDSLVLRDASGAETRLPRHQIEEMKRQEVSLMPEGLDRMLSPPELRDLLAFLISLR